MMNEQAVEKHWSSCTRNRAMTNALSLADKIFAINISIELWLSILALSGLMTQLWEY